ncbi:MAG: hypothetical protein ACRDQ2_19890 [Gaiellales bacterium]
MSRFRQRQESKRIPGEEKRATRGFLACGLLIAVTLGVAACGGDGDDEAQLPQAGVTEYVGKVAGSQFFIALAVDQSGKVEAYTCDGRGHFESFTGTADDGKLRLRSKDRDATLEATIAAGDAEGTLSLQGKALDFSARKAEGLGGLYTVTNTPGRFTAESERGNRLKGRTKEDGTPSLAATLTTPDSEQERVDFVQGMGEPPRRILGFNRYRVVLLDSGEGRGNQTIDAARVGTAVLQQNANQFVILTWPSRP